jgi:chromosome segregation ATPase
MSQTPEELCAEIERHNKDLTAKIDDLLTQQMKLQSEIGRLQRKKDSADKPRIEKLKKAREEATTMIGVLAKARTDLLDGLPIITDAAGELDVIAADLAADAKLIERAQKRIEKVTKTIQKGEKLIVKVISLLKGGLL